MEQIKPTKSYFSSGRVITHSKESRLCKGCEAEIRQEFREMDKWDKLSKVEKKKQHDKMNKLIDLAQQGKACMSCYNEI